MCIEPQASLLLFRAMTRLASLDEQRPDLLLEKFDVGRRRCRRKDRFGRGNGVSSIPGPARPQQESQPRDWRSPPAHNRAIRSPSRNTVSHRFFEVPLAEEIDHSVFCGSQGRRGSRTSSYNPSTGVSAGSSSNRPGSRHSGLQSGATEVQSGTPFAPFS